MTETDREKFRAKLDEFSKRLDAHLRDFKEQGEFTDARQTLAEDIGQRHDKIEKKLALAEANGTAWDVIQSEMERDFNSLFDDLHQHTQRLDDDEMQAKDRPVG